MDTKQLNNVLLCENDGHYFFYDAMTGFFSETTQLFNIVVESLSKKNDINGIKEALSSSYNTPETESIIREISNLVKKGVIFNNKKRPVIRCADILKQEWDNGNVLENLVLNISHECNMACKYCFADHGHFQNTAAIMSEKVAKDSIDYWFKHLDKSRKQTNITFFGGEPLLNKKIFLYSLEYIEQLLKGAGIIPKYAITTNGTLIDDEMIQTFIKYRIQPDISIDGGKLIQDKNRPLNSGCSSYEIVAKNVKKLRRYYNRLVAKITLIHEDVSKLRQSVNDLWDMGFTDVVYIFALTGDKELAIKKEDIDILRKELFDLADITYQNIISGSPGRVINFIDMGYRLHNNIVRNECSFLNPFTVHITPDGKIYKCGKMVGMKGCCMGDIYSDVQWERFISKQKKYLADNDNCNVCWAKRICGGGCAYANKIYSDNFDVVNPLYCEEKKVQLEASIYLYTKLYLYSKKDFTETYSKPMKGPCIKQN